MIRSLSTGVSGLTNHQVRMDVIGNNIANVNTIAFKKSRVIFSDVLAEEMQGVGRFPGGDATNPSFVGLGMRVNSIDKNWNQGAFENTNIATDMAVNGDGFFLVKSGDRTLMTRAGNFNLNSDGKLVTASGLPVQGFPIDQATGDPIMTGTQDVQIDIASKAPPKFTSEISIGGNLDSSMSNNGGVNPDSLPMSSIVYDHQGNAHTINVTFVKTSADGVSPDTYEVTIDGDATANPFLAPTVFDAEFDASGQLVSVDGVAITDPAFVMPTIGWDPNFVNVTGTDTVSIDLTPLTQYAGGSSATIIGQDGNTSGDLVGITVSPTGIIQLSYDSGEQVNQFQLAMGRVNNVNGLEQLGENFYAETGVSGSIQIGRAGNEISASVLAGTLEMSNVDLANEFAEMIKTQRGFQASARIIRVSDELLTETVNLKR